MKTTSHLNIAHCRIDSEPQASRLSRSFPITDQNFQGASLLGSCGKPAQFHRPAFFELSNRYFADEAPRGFAVDAAVFAALILTALFPIVNGVQAIATLTHTAGLL